jgi:hypothetical protein
VTQSLGVAIVAAVLAVPSAAQELEPRALFNAPVGVNFLIVAAGYADGGLLFDAALPLEDGSARLATLGVGYVRSVGVFGMAGKVGLVLPSATGRWEATVASRDTSTDRTGIGDPILKFSLNFVGSPALTMKEFRDYHQSTVVGITVMATVPVGQYFPDRLVNLGSNRWSFSPRLGASQVVGRWMFDAYAGAAYFTTNDDFYGGRTLEQDPFFDVQAHAIYAIHGRDLWAAASVGYGWGGRSTVDGVQRGRLENTRISGVLRLPIGRVHALKLVYINGLVTGLGADFDTFQIAYQYAWGGKR